MNDSLNNQEAMAKYHFQVGMIVKFCDDALGPMGISKNQDPKNEYNLTALKRPMKIVGLIDRGDLLNVQPIGSKFIYFHYGCGWFKPAVGSFFISELGGEVI